MTIRNRMNVGRCDPIVWLTMAACSIALVGTGACGGEGATSPSSTTTTSAISTTTEVERTEVPAADPQPSVAEPQATLGTRDVAAVVAEFDRLDQECRGQSGDLASTWLACDLREAFAVDLEARGLCLGEQEWSVCGSTSERERITGSCDGVDGAFDIETSQVDCASAEALIREVSETALAAEVPTTVDRFTCLLEDGPGGSIVRCGDYGTGLDPVDTTYGAAIWSFRS